MKIKRNDKEVIGCLNFWGKEFAKLSKGEKYYGASCFTAGFKSGKNWADMSLTLFRGDARVD